MRPEQTNTRPTFAGFRLAPMRALAALAPLGAAQDESASDGAAAIENQRPPSFTLTLGASASYRFESGFDSGMSDVSVGRIGATAEGAFLVGDASRLALNFTTEHSFYDFSPMGILVPGGVDPFDTIHEYGVGVLFTTRINDRWSAAFGGGVKSAGESSASFEDTLTFNGLLGATYRVNDSLSIGGAIIISSRLEDDVTVIPVPTITWDIDERWRLESRRSGLRLESNRAGLSLSYKTSETMRVGIEAGFELREFRLDDTGPLPMGVVRESRIPVGAWAEWKPTPNVTLVGTVGADVYVEFESLTGAGVKFADDETDPAVYAGISASFSF